MNPRFIGAIIATFLFIFGYDFVFHGLYMGEAYAATASLWRPEADMPQYMLHMSIGQALIALGIVWVVFRTERGGWAAGMITGLTIAVISAGGNAIMFAVQPLPSDMVCSWIFSGFIQAGVAGAIAGAIYKPQL